MRAIPGQTNTCNTMYPKPIIIIIMKITSVYGIHITITPKTYERLKKSTLLIHNAKIVTFTDLRKSTLLNLNINTLSVVGT